MVRYGPPPIGHATVLGHTVSVETVVVNIVDVEKYVVGLLLVGDGSENGPVVDGTYAPDEEVDVESTKEEVGNTTEEVGRVKVLFP